MADFDPALEEAAAMLEAEWARRAIAKAPAERTDWNAGYLAVQDRNIYGANAELIDIEPLVPGEPVVLDDDVSVSDLYGYDPALGYFVEANTGPGGPR